MQTEIFIFFEIIMIVLFIFSFFTKQEILWALTLILSGVLAFTSFNIEYYWIHWNSTINDYTITTVSNNYPYLMGLNAAFFVLALILLLFDLWEKYGWK